MTLISNLLSEIDERTIARQIGIPHDEARMAFSLSSNTVNSFDEFNMVISHYYIHHFTSCISHGGSLSPAEASGSAKEIIEQQYRRRNGDVVSAYNDCRDGTNGGMRVVLDTIAEELKAQSVERYVRDVFDRHVAPSCWEDKVSIVRQFIAKCGEYLSSSIRADQPERYARDYQILIRSYVTALQNTSSIFRRL